MHYGHCKTEDLAIVKWCLNPSAIGSLRYENSFYMLAMDDRSISQHNRSKAIWEQAPQSIDRDVGETVKFEAEVLVKTLKRLRETIKTNHRL